MEYNPLTHHSRSNLGFSFIHAGDPEYEEALRQVQTEGGGVDDRPEIGPDPGLGNGLHDATTTETEETTEETTIEIYGIVRVPVQAPLSPSRRSPRSRGYDNQGGPSSSSVRDRPRLVSPTASLSSHEATSRDKEPTAPLSRKVPTSTSTSATSAAIPMSPRSSNRSSSSNPSVNGSKTDLDSTFKRSGLGQKKADNPFKSPAGPLATSTLPNSSSNNPKLPSNAGGLRHIDARGSSSQTQTLAWKPIRAKSPAPGQSPLENADVPSTSQDKGKGKEKEVLSAPMKVEATPEAAMKPVAAPPRTTKEEWLKKIRLLVAAVETRAKHLEIKSELNNLKLLQDRYSVKGEQNSEGRKRLNAEVDKKVAAEKAAVAKLKELCFKLASGTPGDDEPDFQPQDHKQRDSQNVVAVEEEQKRLLVWLNQIQAEVHQVTKAVSDTSEILANHRASVAAVHVKTVLHDEDGDVDMDTAQPIAGASSSLQTNQAVDHSLLNEITKLKRQIELLDQGLEDARAEVEDARVTLVAKIDSLAEVQARPTSEDMSDNQEALVSQQDNSSNDALAQRVDKLNEEVAFVATIVADATDKTTGMSLKGLRDENVELRERLEVLEQDRARRNGIIDQLAKRLAQVQGPPLPTEELRNEIVERTRTALRPILHDFENKNEEAVKKAEMRLTKQLRDSLEDVGAFFSRLKNLPGDGGAGVADLHGHSPSSSMTDSSMH
ncbi:hypothetical protein FRC04_000475 [Tulasnella sp. 424]|nr:hypothetical protein FRC04_000475 [Tulasnella sp. 424]